MIYDAYGSPYQTPALFATKKMLPLLGEQLKNAFSRSILDEVCMINDLRKSCGVEPSGGKTITFRRYKKDVAGESEK